MAISGTVHRACIEMPVDISVPTFWGAPSMFPGNYSNIRLTFFCLNLDAFHIKRLPAFCNEMQFHRAVKGVIPG
jgi:hypothetical protein